MANEFVEVYEDGDVEIIEVLVTGPMGPPGPPGIGTQGPPGEPGPSTIPGFYQGEGPPTEDTLEGAAVGSSYLDIQTHTLYRKD